MAVLVHAQRPCAVLPVVLYLVERLQAVQPVRRLEALRNPGGDADRSVTPGVLNGIPLKGDGDVRLKGVPGWAHRPYPPRAQYPRGAVPPSAVFDGSVGAETLVLAPE
jgi:hypothetical protein